RYYIGDKGGFRGKTRHCRQRYTTSAQTLRQTLCAPCNRTLMPGKQTARAQARAASGWAWSVLAVGAAGAAHAAAGTAGAARVGGTGRLRLVGLERLRVLQLILRRCQLQLDVVRISVARAGAAAAAGASGAA